MESPIWAKNGFIIIQTSKSEESRKLRTWSFTRYNTNLEVEWTKSMDYEKNLTILEMNSMENNVNIVFYLDRSYDGIFVNGEKVGDLTVMKITSDGEIVKKDIEFDENIRLYKGSFVNNAYYFDANIKKVDKIMKIDFNTLSLSSNIFTLPENTDIVSRTTDGRNVYFRVKSYKKKISYDALYTIEDGVVVDKTTLKNSDYDDIDYMTVIRPDSAHRFMLGLTYKEVLAKKKKDDIITQNFYITNLQTNNVEEINNIDMESSDMLLSKRNVSLKNNLLAFMLFSNAVFLQGDHFLISNCYRFKGKNFIVFDKYQEVKESYKEYDAGSRRYVTRIRLIGYLFTNSVAWCFNDSGEVEWSRNFEYEIFSTDAKPKICSRPYGENAIALLGYFNNKLSYKTISLSGEVAEDSDNFVAKVKTNKTNIFQVSNSNEISHLYDNTYLVWGKENDFNSDENTSKKKEYNILFEIVNFE